MDHLPAAVHIYSSRSDKQWAMLGHHSRAKKDDRMDALFEQLSALADTALDGRGFDPAQLAGVLALFECQAQDECAAAEAEHAAVSRDTELAVETAQDHLDAVMDAAVGTYRGSSGRAGALSAATAAMETAFKATSSGTHP
jgi:hypothetical protein